MKTFRPLCLTACLLIIYSLTSGKGASAQTAPLTPDEIFDWAERQYSTLFPRGNVTRTLPDAGGTIFYRHYQSAGNYLGIQSDNILGMGTLTGGPLTKLGTIADIRCQILPGSCGSGVIRSKRFLPWEEVATPTRNSAVRQFEGAIYCGAN